jgi:hypothetical protein
MLKKIQKAWNEPALPWVVDLSPNRWLWSMEKMNPATTAGAIQSCEDACASASPVGLVM